MCCGNHSRDNCKYIAKHIHKNYNEEELKIQKLVSKSGLAPKIFDDWRCEHENEDEGTDGEGKEGHVIIMEKMDMTLNEAVDKVLEEDPSLVSLISLIIEPYKKLSKIVCHSDLHLNNIMLNVYSSTIDVKFIDFGKSTVDTGECYDIIDLYRDLQGKVNTHKNDIKDALYLLYINFRKQLC